MMPGRALDRWQGMNPRIAHVISVMEADIDGCLTVTALAAAVNLSPSRLAVLFRQETGVSPARFLHALRMERARLLLERTFLSVKEVMAFVGVNDPSHFSRDFSRHHGVAPSRLRERSWAPEAWRGRGIRQVTREAANQVAAPAPAGADIVEQIVGDGAEKTRPLRGRQGDGDGDHDP